VVQTRGQTNGGGKDAPEFEGEGAEAVALIPAKPAFLPWVYI